MLGCSGRQKHSATKFQIWLAMKLTVVFVMLACLYASANGTAQTVTYKGKNVPLEQVFTAIKKQTGYLFFYRNDDLSQSKPVTVQLKNAPLQTALQTIFQNQPLSYSVKGNTIVISYKSLQQSPVAGAADALPPINIKGRVVNEKGEPVVVTITVKGSNKATSSNENGDFELKDVDENATLIISGVSVETREVKVAGRSFLNIEVNNRVTATEEVVISTGYQTLKKTQLTGAYATIGRETYLQTVPTSGNIVENMEGRIAGLVLNVNQSRNNWADPDNTSPFTIRGVSTFQAIKKPLIVLNGYPTEIDIESINPYDIESITVLKDAASAAIYGVRASNGVIIINTRKGVAGTPSFHFNTALTFKPKPNYNKLNLLKGRDYIDFEAAAGVNDIENNFNSKEFIEMMNGTYTPVFSITEDLYNGVISESEADKLYNQLAAYDNTDDYKKLFLQNQFLQTYDFNVSGGGGNATYFLGINRVDNKLSAKSSDYNKTSVNYRGNFDFGKRISLDVQTIYTNINTSQVPVPDYFQLRPYQRFLDENGNPLPAYFSPFNEKFFGFGQSYGTLSAAQNEANMAMGLYDENYYPYQEMFESSTKTRSDMYRVQANLKARITTGLNLEMGGVFERQSDRLTDLASENAYQTRLMLNYFAKMDPLTGQPIFQIPQGGVKKTTDNLINSYTLRAQLTYNKVLGEKHNLSLLGGSEVRRITNEGSLQTTFGYNDNLLTIKPADLNLLSNFNYFPDYYDVIVPYTSFPIDQSFYTDWFNNTYRDDRFVSYYANGAYTYNQRYTLTASLRIDQSNLFGTNPKFRYTPLWSAGFSWNLLNENFLAGNKTFDELKLRIAAGYNGNILKGSGPFNILRSQVNTLLPNPLVGYAISSPRNNSLRWEKTFNFNAGVDFGVFDGRLSGSVDYYVKRGEDIFASIAADPTLGFNNLKTNNASIENRGVDVSLNSLNVHSGKFSWLSSLTGSFNQSKVLDVKNRYAGFYNFTRAGGAENIVGHPMNSVLALDYAGLSEMGQPLVRNAKGELVVLSFENQTDIDFGDLIFAGVNDPKYVIGFNNQFNFGSFSLSALLMYYGGHVGLVQPPSIFSDRPEQGIQGFWKQPGDENTTNIPGFGGAYGTPEYIEVRSGYQYGIQFVRKFDYIAVRDVTLTYNMNNGFSKRLGLNNTKIILQVQNPGKYVFSGNDVDPESFDFIMGKRGLPVVPAFTFSLSTNF